MKLYKRNLYRYTKGMSLIEVMIAMTLSLLLLAGAISLFINNQRVYRQNDQSARLQESARLTMELLRKDIRRAGFIGCHHNIDNMNNVIERATDPDDDGTLYDMFIGAAGSRTSLAIEGLDSAGDRWLPSGNDALVATGVADGDRFAIANGSDAITIRYLEGEFWPVLADNDAADPADGFPATTNARAVVSTIDNNPDDGRNNDRANNFVQGEILGIGDCNRSLLFQAGNIVNGGILPAADGGNIIPGSTAAGNSQFDRVYGDGASVRRYRAVRYYIGNGAYGGPSLFRQTIITLPDPAVTVNLEDEQELVEGVEAMRILYGVDTDGDGTANTFDDAAAVGNDNWGNVVSVRIAVLIRTVSEQAREDNDTATYSLLDEDIDPPDLRVRRRVFETAVQIRNRIIDQL